MGRGPIAKLTDNLRTIGLFAVAFVATSFLFSFLSWGEALSGPSGASPAILVTTLPVHLVGHVALGALSALPSLRLSLVVAGGASAILMDVDHTGSYLGLPMDGRASHAIPFALLAAVIVFIVAPRIPRLGTARHAAASVALGAALSHLALDSMDGNGLPLWMPFVHRIVALPGWPGIGLEFAAVATVACGALLDKRRMRRAPAAMAARAGGWRA